MILIAFIIIAIIIKHQSQYSYYNPTYNASDYKDTLQKVDLILSKGLSFTVKWHVCRMTMGGGESINPENLI